MRLRVFCLAALVGLVTLFGTIQPARTDKRPETIAEIELHQQARACAARYGRQVPGRLRDARSSRSAPTAIRALSSRAVHAGRAPARERPGQQRGNERSVRRGTRRDEVPSGVGSVESLKKEKTDESEQWDYRL
jgi:hypothetical protein